MALETVQLRSMLAAGLPVADAACDDVDWSDLDAEAATFKNCQINAVHFANTDSSGARFTRCRFPQARFSHVNLRDAVFENCVFVERATEAAGCVFMLSEMQQARFERCDLSFTTFERSDMFAIETDQCNLRGAGATLRDCDLFQTVLTKARLDGADLRGAEISGLKLQHLARFMGLKITRSQQRILLNGLCVDVHPDPG